MRSLAFWWVLALVVVVLTEPWTVWAQQADTQVQAAFGLSLDLQRRAVIAQDLAVALAQAQQRIASLEKLCGEPCKPLAEAK